MKSGTSSTKLMPNMGLPTCHDELTIRTLDLMRSPVLFWAILLISGLAILAIPLPLWERSPTVRVFKVEASRFAYAPAVLQANPGDTVTIELTSTDVVHGLAVDGYGVETTADPGQTARLTFLADRSGSFRLRCTATCGPMHPFMIGKLQVGRNELLWRGTALAFVVVAAVWWKTRL